MGLAERAIEEIVGARAGRRKAQAVAAIQRGAIESLGHRLAVGLADRSRQSR